MPSLAGDIGFPTWYSLKLDSTSRWLGASHSDSQKSVLCKNVAMVTNLVSGAVEFPPSGLSEQWS